MREGTLTLPMRERDDRPREASDLQVLHKTYGE
jgi:hypothetical protein